MSSQHPVGDALRRRAGDVGASEHPLVLDDVKARANAIRRRRAALSGVAAAAVLAVTVPIGIALDDRVTGGADRGPAASGPASGPSSVPGSEAPREGVLTNRVDVGSQVPDVPYLLDGVIHTPSDEELPVEGDYDELAALGDGWLATDVAAGKVFFLDSSGEVAGTDAATGELAVSPDGTVVVYATPGGELMSATDDEAQDIPLLLPLNDPSTAPSHVQPVGVRGSGSCREDSEGGGCAVFFNGERDLVPQGFSATSHGITDQLGNLREVGGVSPEGPLVGTVSVTDDGSCSAMWDAAWEEAWTTCEHTLGRFSPDGRHVIGHPPYRDGIGDGSVAILDAASGDVLAEWRSTEDTQAFINSVAWDTDGSLLATVWEKDSWSLMRMSSDGSLTTVLAGLGESMDEAPLRIAARP